MLEVRGLTQRFGDLLALDGVSFEVSTHEIVGLVGRNGAGKTTTMRAIMGVLDPDAGEVSWAGHPVGRGDHRRFGYMPEERGLYPQMRLLDQVRYFATLHGLDRERATREAKVWIERLGLGGREEDRLVALSHGNQQRVQLAVALVHEPALLVLDEPFAGLDPAAVDDLSDILRAEAGDGTAVLFSSHQLDLVERLCERVVILDQGRVLAEGLLDELRGGLPQRLRVRVDAAADWASGLEGVHLESDGPDGLVFTLDEGTDTQTLLRAAMRAGTVQHFGFESAGLVDLYRQLVGR